LDDTGPSVINRKKTEHTILLGIYILNFANNKLWEAETSFGLWYTGPLGKNREEVENTSLYGIYILNFDKYIRLKVTALFFYCLIIG
jgi:hypothetical protein